MASQPPSRPLSRRRFTRPTQRQMEALVDFLERNPEVAKGLLKTQQGKMETRRKWQEFATAANALGGVIKDGPAWAKYWSEKKCSLRTRCTERAQSMTRTGGGVDVLSELSLLEQRLVAVMGGLSFATGDSGLAVNPFPHSSSQPSASILDQPSTSSAASETEPLLVVVVADTEEQVQLPLQDPAETSQQVEASSQGEARLQGDAGPQGEARLQGEAGPMATRRARAPRLNQQDRPSRSVTFLETQVRRFEEIELRRVEAERQTAQALSQIAAAFMEMIALLRLYLERDGRLSP